MRKTLSAVVAHVSGCDFANEPCSSSRTRGSSLYFEVQAVGQRLRRPLLFTWVLVCIAACFLVTASAVYGQIDRGNIEGIVTDQSGAVVPDAKVQVINNQTNSALDLKSNGQGLYTAPNLPTGMYRVVVTKEGFSTVTREQVDVQPSITVRVDFSLAPGQVTQTVRVTGEAPLLDVGTTNNSTGMQDNLIESIPLIVAGTQRSITDYLGTLPGYTGGTGFTPTANGQLAGDTETYIDGGPASEWGIARGGIEEVSPQVEQVGEISVVANAFNAEYGGFGSWFTNVILKSGTNELHGSFYDHLGNSAFDAKAFFATAVTPYRQNEGGFTIGGPVVLPKIYNGRNKTFFFASLGLFYSRQGAAGGLLTVPTPAECNASDNGADFSQLSTLYGVNIYDPATTSGGVSQQFEYNGHPNVIPPGRITQAGKVICSYIPAPTGPNAGTPLNNFINLGAPTWPYFNTYTPLIKIDHSISDKEKLSASYTSEIRHRLLSGNTVAFHPAPAWGEQQKEPLDDYFDQIANSWKVRISLDSVIRPSLLNHVTLSFDRYINLGPNGTDGQNWDSQLGITGMPDDNGAFPAITFSGGTAPPTNYGRAYEEDWHEMNYTADENLTWTRGKNFFKFGFEIGQHQENRFIKPGLSGAFTFSNDMTSMDSADDTDGSAFASMLLGAVDVASTYIPANIGLRFDHYGFFGQDDWHLTPKLTVSYGLRWDYDPPEGAQFNKMSSFEAGLTNPGAGNLPGALAFAGSGAEEYGKPFQDTWRKGFAPRLGLAYQLNKKTMIRASSGIYYSEIANQIPFLDTGAAGYSAAPHFESPDSFTPLYYWNAAGSAGSFPNTYEKPPSKDPSFLNGQSISYIPRNGDRMPQTLNWVLDIEREVIPNLSLDVMYIGSHSTHLALSGSPAFINYLPASDLSMGFGLLAPCEFIPGCTVPFSGFNNQIGLNTVYQALKPYPQYNLVGVDAVLLPEGAARYNSLQIKATKRTSFGLSGLAFFTWMKNMTDTGSTPGDNTYATFVGSRLQYPAQNPITYDPSTPATIFGTSWTYQLPFGKGRTFANKINTPTDLFIGGWTLSGNLRYTDGTALQIDALSPFIEDFGYQNVYGPPEVFANYVGGNPHGHWSGKYNPYTDNCPGVLNGTNSAAGCYFNPAAFTSPGFFAFGNTASALPWLRGFTQGSESLEFGKTLPIHKRLNFDLSGDFVNPFNIVRWANPGTFAVGIPGFGQVTNTQGSPRQIQINMKVRF